MKQYPPVPSVADAPAGLFESGHLWIQELVAGPQLRVRLDESGVLRFGGRTRTFDADAVPVEFAHAVRHVRERFDRDALRDAVADPEAVVFYGVATTRREIAYDWDRVPSFLGFDVWDGAAESFLPPDAVERVYDRLGLDAVNAVSKEVRAVDFDPDDHEIPDSAWYDGPAAGAVVRNKTGQRAAIPNPEVTEREAPASSAETSAKGLAREHATSERVDRVVRDLERRGRPVAFDAVFERVVEAIAREQYPALFEGRHAVDEQAFRSAVAARVQRLLDA